jgi:protein O-GlcNAc transferase
VIIKLNKIIKKKLADINNLIIISAYESANRICDEVLNIDRNNPKALHYKGIIFYLSGDLNKAYEFLNLSIKIYPNDAKLYSDIGLVFFKLNRIDKALECFNKCILLDKNFHIAFSNLGDIYYKEKKFSEAIINYEKSLMIIENKNNYIVLTKYGNALNAINNFKEAENQYNKAITAKSDYAEAYFNKAILFKKIKAYEKSMESIDYAISYKENFDQAHAFKAMIYYDLKDYINAVQSLILAIKINPESSEYYDYLGVNYLNLNKLEDAEQSFKLAVSKNINNSSAICNIGLIHQKRNDLKKALDYYNEAIHLNKKCEIAYVNKSVILREFYKLDESLIEIDNALNINKLNSFYYTNKGAILHDLKCYSQAIEILTIAITINKNDVNAYINRASAYLMIDNYLNAASDYYVALELNPNIEHLMGLYLYAQLKICQWINFDKLKTNLLMRTSNNENMIDPFIATNIFDDPELLLNINKLNIQKLHPQKNVLGNILKLKGNNKIKIAYYSSDFTEHAVSYLINKLFQLHDKSKFIIYGFSLSKHHPSAMNLKLRSYFDEYFDVHDASDLDIAKMSRSINIDIAIDLGGHTRFNRIGIFSYRAAPIQISYLGFLGGIGAPYYDYLIADKILISDDTRKYYLEKVIFLPSYQVNDIHSRTPLKSFTRASLNIPDDYFVFCCFNNNYKYNPTIFAIWVEILLNTKNTVLILLAENNKARFNLILEATNLGLNVERLRFVERVSYDIYISQFQICNLFLDTWPYNSGTTGTDALSSNVPLLTYCGKSFQSRMGASLLNSLDIKELITFNLTDYKDMAIKLATDKIYYNLLLRKLASNLISKRLFNTQEFTIKLEIAYEKIYLLYANNNKPTDIFIN